MYIFGSPSCHFVSGCFWWGKVDRIRGRSSWRTSAAARCCTPRSPPSSTRSGSLTSSPWTAVSRSSTTSCNSSNFISWTPAAYRPGWRITSCRTVRRSTRRVRRRSRGAFKKKVYLMVHFIDVFLTKWLLFIDFCWERACGRQPSENGWISLVHVVANARCTDFSLHNTQIELVVSRIPTRSPHGDVVSPRFPNAGTTCPRILQGWYLFSVSFFCTLYLIWFSIKSHW